jgi:hypothetical protein
MARPTKLTTEFVDLVPPQLKDGVLYVAMENSCVIHRCCCGCGEKVVTPLSPGEWQLSYDGESITLYPSIGNSRFRCRSHYWIKQGRVEWAPTLSAAETEFAWRMDRAARDSQAAARRPPIATPQPAHTLETPGFFGRLWGKVTGRS